MRSVISRNVLESVMKVKVSLCLWIAELCLLQTSAAQILTQNFDTDSQTSGQEKRAVM